MVIQFWVIWFINDIVDYFKNLYKDENDKSFPCTTNNHWCIRIQSFQLIQLIPLIMLPAQLEHSECVNQLPLSNTERTKIPRLTIIRTSLLLSSCGLFYIFGEFFNSNINSTVFCDDIPYQGNFENTTTISFHLPIQGLIVVKQVVLFEFLELEHSKFNWNCKRS
ncbi:hypothetical protein ACTFIY_010629 [Dictyostelium cf. discoideum]